MSQLPYVELTAEQKSAHKEIMCAGNIALKTSHAAARQNYNGKRFPRSKFRTILFDKLKGRVCRIQIFGVWIDRSEIEKIVAVKDAQGEILLGYTRMLTTVVASFAKQDLPPIIESDDLYDEAVVGLLRATYGFISYDTEFSTYAFTCVQRRLVRFINRSFPMTKRSAADCDLYARYQEQKRENNGPASFDAIVDAMELNERQRASLERMLVKVFSHTLTSDGVSENEGTEEAFSERFIGDRGDYHSVGRSNNQLVYKKDDGLELDMLDAVKEADLSGLERATLDGFLQGAGRGRGRSGKSGWMLEVAREQGVSRMSITYAFRRVKKKILETYSKEELKKLISDKAA